MGTAKGDIGRPESRDLRAFVIGHADGDVEGGGVCAIGGVASERFVGLDTGGLMRRVGLMAMVVTLVVVGSVVPAVAQAEEPGAEVIDIQIPEVLDLGATGCNFSPGSPVRIAFSGGGGSAREFSTQVQDDTCFSWSPPRLDPCRLGGSDLPGARYTVKVNVEADGYSLDQLITLEPDTAGPRFLAPPFDASPKPGDKVEAGDEIGFEVTAVEQSPPKVWQTGVHTLEVTGPRGSIGRPQQAGANAKACEAKSKSLTVQGSYRVRRSDPAVVELCAVARDYVPNENKKCAQWYKGEVWEGTMNNTVTLVGASSGHNPCGDPQHLQGKAVFVVEANGKVTGTYDVTGCNVSQPHAEWTGTATDEGFSFPQLIVQTNGELIPKVSPKRAHATLTNLQGSQAGGAQWVTEWDMRCVSC
jgi:hypothetical protein